MSERPIWIVGSPHDAGSVGDGSANGGVKSQALWVSLLREHGYEAYFVTFDGSQIQWLIEHPPVVSIATVKQWKAEGKPLKGVTTWFWSNAFFDVFDRYYMYDEELAMTSSYQHQRFLLEQHLREQRIIKLATHSRTQVGWYMSAYDFAPTYIPLWCGEQWQPDDRKRIPNRIGFFEEGRETMDDIAAVKRICEATGLHPEFFQCGGSEITCLEQMQSCDIFLGANRGKWKFGEGSPLSQVEAMRAGAVLVAFNVWGNYEYLIDGYTGYMVGCGDTAAMATRVIELLTGPNRWLLEGMREQSIDLTKNAFSADNRWPSVRDFLDLEAD